MDSVDKALSAGLFSDKGKLRVSFKKTVKTGEYETEVIEATNELELEQKMEGLERVLALTVMKVQLEFTVYVDMLAKGLVTEEEFKERKECMRQGLDAIIGKAVSNGVNVDNVLLS